jgi:transcriptional regulator with GAF, ATPase, and Fis domain
VEAEELVGCSRVHNDILSKLSRIAGTDAEILLTGPSGVGKELYANFAHSQSARGDLPFVPVNCGALSSELLENELFGHVGGAFTGARGRSDGLVAEAEGGTLFLDELDTLNLACQVKLLRFLQDKHYRRLGETRLRKANIRVIAATNTDLESAVRNRVFRKDLYFRLRVAPVHIPPLCERPADINELVDYFLQRCAAEYKLTPVRLDESVRLELLRYSWPGNVRELQNCIAYVTCLQLDRPVKDSDLPLLRDSEVIDEGPTKARSNFSIVGANLNQTKKEVWDTVERGVLDQTLRMTNGNVAAAARLCDKDPRVLRGLIDKHGLKLEDYRIAPPN